MDTKTWDITKTYGKTKIGLPRCFLVMHLRILPSVLTPFGLILSASWHSLVAIVTMLSKRTSENSSRNSEFPSSLECMMQQVFTIEHASQHFWNIQVNWVNVKCLKAHCYKQQLNLIYPADCLNTVIKYLYCMMSFVPQVIQLLQISLYYTCVRLKLWFSQKLAL